MFGLVVNVASLFQMLMGAAAHPAPTVSLLSSCPRQQFQGRSIEKDAMNRSVYAIATAVDISYCCPSFCAIFYLLYCAVVCILCLAVRDAQCDSILPISY